MLSCHLKQLSYLFPNLHSKALCSLHTTKYLNELHAFFTWKGWALACIGDFIWFGAFCSDTGRPGEVGSGKVFVYAIDSTENISSIGYAVHQNVITKASQDLHNSRVYDIIQVGDCRVIY